MMCGGVMCGGPLIADMHGVLKLWGLWRYIVCRTTLLSAVVVELISHIPVYVAEFSSAVGCAGLSALWLSSSCLVG
jgi:hypothetical protein